MGRGTVREYTAWFVLQGDRMIAEKQTIACECTRCERKAYAVMGTDCQWCRGKFCARLWECMWCHKHVNGLPSNGPLLCSECGSDLWRSWEF